MGPNKQLINLKEFIYLGVSVSVTQRFADDAAVLVESKTENTYCFICCTVLYYSFFYCTRLPKLRSYFLLARIDHFYSDKSSDKMSRENQWKPEAEG